MEYYNLDSEANSFIYYARVQVKVGQNYSLQKAHFPTNHIMFLMGSDFQWMNAKQNFKNLDKLMTYSNSIVGQHRIYPSRCSAKQRHLLLLDAQLLLRWPRLLGGQLQRQPQ